MTTLYKPVLIETAEQAEALPLGTVAFIEISTQEPDLIRPSESKPFIVRSTAAKATGNHWLTVDHSRGDVNMVGWTALVPIEAEEETLTHFCTPGCREGDYCTGPMSSNTRLVTPWEEA